MARLKFIDILQVPDNFKLQLAKFMYNYSHNTLPKCFKDYFVEIKNKHTYYTRVSVNNYFVPRKNCFKGQSGLNYLGPILWSEIPDKIKDTNSIKLFTVTYKNVLSESYFI